MTEPITDAEAAAWQADVARRGCRDAGEWRVIWRRQETCQHLFTLVGPWRLLDVRYGTPLVVEARYRREADGWFTITQEA